jgi:hypothetical protein
MRNTITSALIFILVALSACEYRKGDAYTYTGTGDTVKYFVIASGSGKHIAKRIAYLREMHIMKNDDCSILYVSDSIRIPGHKSILLFNSVLPEVKDDMLTKGMLGTFGTKQIITYLAVTREDFDRYFKPSVPK